MAVKKNNKNCFVDFISSLITFFEAYKLKAQCG